MRVWRHCLVLFLAAILSALLCGCTAKNGDTAHIQPSFDVTQIQEDSSWGWYPDVSGDRVVWYGIGVTGGGDDFEIFTWTAAAGVVQITDNELEDMAPRVCGDRVVWQRNMTPEAGLGLDVDNPYDFEIFTWTPDEGIVRITENDSWDRGPKVSGDRVVWSGRGGSDGGSDWEIFTWTPDAGIIQLTRNDSDDGGAWVSGKRIVWDGGDDSAEGEGREVFTWTPSEGVIQLTHNGRCDSAPSVSGDRVVWSAGVDPAGDEDLERILMWTPTSGVVEIATSAHELGITKVSGDLVVWMGRGGSDGGRDWEVFTWMPGDGVRQLTENDIDDIAPHASDELMVWTAFEGKWAVGEGMVVAWPIGLDSKGEMLGMTEGTLSEPPAVSGGRLVWVNGDHGISTGVLIEP